jgi:hypothetical protein
MLIPGIFIDHQIPEGMLPVRKRELPVMNGIVSLHRFVEAVERVTVDDAATTGPRIPRLYGFLS